MKDNRKEERIETRGGVLYTVSSSDNEEKIYSGLLDDISESGACIFVQESIVESALIKVFFREISPAPAEAKVMWCAQESNNLYRVGLLLEGQA